MEFVQSTERLPDSRDVGLKIAGGATESPIDQPAYDGRPRRPLALSNSVQSGALFLLEEDVRPLHTPKTYTAPYLLAVR